MSIKLHDMMWLHLGRLMEDAGKIDVILTMGTLEKRHTYLSQPEVITTFQTSKQTLAKLRAKGMPFITTGTGDRKRFYYREQDVKEYLGRD